MRKNQSKCIGIARVALREARLCRRCARRTLVSDSRKVPQRRPQCHRPSAVEVWRTTWPRWGCNGPCLNDKVHLRTGGGTPEIHTRLLPPVDLGLDQLPKHDSFEERSSQGTAEALFLGLDARQVAQNARVREIDLGRFHQTLAGIAIVGTQDRHLVACLQDGQPSPDRIDSQAKLAGDLRGVEQLTVSGSQRPQKGLELVSGPPPAAASARPVPDSSGCSCCATTLHLGPARPRAPDNRLAACTRHTISNAPSAGEEASLALI